MLIENIECLGEQMLNSLKSVIVDNLSHVTFLCTTRKPHLARLVLGTTSLVLHCDYDIRAIVKAVVDQTRPELAPFIEELVSEFRNDMGLFAMTMHYQRPHVYVSHIESFVREKIRGLLMCKETEVYDFIRELIVDMMSSFINFKDISTHVLSYARSLYPKSIYEVIKLVACCDSELAQSNKIVFGFELFFLRLYALLSANTKQKRCVNQLVLDIGQGLCIQEIKIDSNHS